MWVFTRDGFYSAVADRNDPERLIVRARARRDIVALARRTGAPWRRTPPPADYGWRASLTRDEWARYLASEAIAIDYPNFKKMVRDRLGAARERVYSTVWSTLLWGLQPRPAWSRRRAWDRLDFDDQLPF